MDTKTLLEQFLNSAKSLTEQGRDLAEDKLGVPESGVERDAMLSGMGKGALAAGALAMLLGTGAGRRITGSALKLGGLAAVGGIAYKAFQNWQAGKALNPSDIGKPIGDLSGTDEQNRSEKLLVAMISAAKADGHIDSEELANIKRQLPQLGFDSDAAAFIEAELAKPLDVGGVAALADTPETAAEIYLASRLLIDVENDLERRYLQDLARAMKLESGMVTQLEQQVSNA